MKVYTSSCHHNVLQYNTISHKALQWLKNKSRVRTWQCHNGMAIQLQRKHHIGWLSGVPQGDVKFDNQFQLQLINGLVIYPEHYMGARH